MQLDKIISENVYKEPIDALEIQRKPFIINTINAHSYCVAKRDQVFANALKKADVLLPDGFGIVLANKILFGTTIEKIAGADIHEYLLKMANRDGNKVFYLGASENTLRLIEERIALEFPNISVSSYSPPFKPKFSDKDSAEMIRNVNLFEPDFVFVGMTAPKQEKWVFEHSEKINAQVVTQIGAVFDFYAGTVKRPSMFWSNLGLEWVIRTIRSPKRLLRRNLVSTPKFLLEILSYKLLKRGVL